MRMRFVASKNVQKVIDSAQSLSEQLYNSVELLLLNDYRIINNDTLKIYCIAQQKGSKKSYLYLGRGLIILCL